MEATNVVTEGMYMRDCHTAEDLKKRFELEAVMEGLEDLDNGRMTDADVFFDKLDAESF